LNGEGKNVSSNQIKSGVVWARVSTKGQREISLDTQVVQCRAILKAKGYVAIKIFSIDFSSLDLSVCPEFIELEAMVNNREISAIAVYDRDRLMADGIDRLVFLSQLKENNIELLICNGAPIIDSDEGQIVELALAIGKKRAVLRTRFSSRDGMRSRVTLKRKPANHHNVWGFDWEKDHERLVPNADYGNLKAVFDLALGGAGYAKIGNELAKKGINPPRGNVFSKGQISNLLHNTVYAGRYFALRTSVVRDDQPGKKVRKIPENQWVYLPEVEIVNPPITWEQRTALLEQIQRHVALGKRHAKREYLFRGMIECAEHVGKCGHIKYHGRIHHQDYGYVCEFNGHQHNFITGWLLEGYIKKIIRDLFEGKYSDADTLPQFWGRLADLQKTNRPQLEADLKKQQVKLSTILKKEAMLEDGKFEGKIDQSVYDLLHAKYHTERLDIETGLKENQQLLDSTSTIAEQVESWKVIREKFLDNAANNFTEGQWRELLEELDCRIMVSSNTDAEWQKVLSMEDHDLLPALLEKERGKHEECMILQAFNAVMFLKTPLQLQPQKVKSIGLQSPHKLLRRRLIRQDDAVSSWG